jgi:hypothetical protein
MAIIGDGRPRTRTGTQYRSPGIRRELVDLAKRYDAAIILSLLWH